LVSWVEGRDPANQTTRKSWVSFLNPAYTYGPFLDSLSGGAGEKRVQERER